MDGPGLERHAGTVRRESAAYPRWRSSRTSREAGARAGIQLAKIKSAFPSDIGNMAIIADDRNRIAACICGNGHLLTPDNLEVDQANRRWRCRRCGRARAAEFRARQRALPIRS